MRGGIPAAERGGGLSIGATIAKCQKVPEPSKNTVKIEMQGRHGKGKGSKHCGSAQEAVGAAPGSLRFQATGTGKKTTGGIDQGGDKRGRELVGIWGG